MKNPLKIENAEGKLGVMLVGLGAVSTTTIAGVIAVRRGLAKPIGSLTQMGTIRLGKRTEGRSPAIHDFVPLASLDDVAFGGWDIFDENCYEAAKTAGVLDAALLDKIKPELEEIRPWPAVFDRKYVKRLDGPNVKKGKNKRELAEQVREDIRRFRKERGLNRLVLIWCGSTEIYMTETPAHASIDAFEKAPGDPEIYSDGLKVNTTQGWREMRLNLLQKRKRADPAAPEQWRDRVLPEASGLEVVSISERAAIVSGLDTEQPRYFLQHALGFQVHDVRHPHYERRHGRADIGWKDGHAS